MKVGKEDIMGMLAAVEMWVQRDHDAEWQAWESWLDEIVQSVKKVDGVTTEVLQPSGLSNYSPRLEIRWDGAKLGIHGAGLEKSLWNHDPRIILAGGSGSTRDGGASSVTVMPWQMEPGDATVVAQVLRRQLAGPHENEAAVSGASPAQVGGQWDMEIDYPVAPARHTLFLEQSGEELSGLHRGDRTGGDVRGWIEGDRVHLSSRHRWEGAVFGFTFDGKAQGETIIGEVDMGEYFTAPFSARRHGRQPPASPSRPQKNV
jgi:L-seryl-tRNA(Ser) seleniumtransferase